MKNLNERLENIENLIEEAKERYKHKDLLTDPAHEAIYSQNEALYEQNKIIIEQNQEIFKYLFKSKI